MEAAALRIKYSSAKDEIQRLARDLARSEGVVAEERRRRVAAEDKARKVLALTSQIHSVATGLRELDKERVVINWHERLGEYLQLTLRQGDRHSTHDTLKAYLAPWVEWLSIRGSLPTDQLIKAYLEKEDFRFV